MEPLVSCVIPTGNREDFLGQALKYFQQQTYGNKELLIVSDGSEPEGDFIPGDDRIRYLHLDRHMAMGAKLNLGIQASRGQIIQKWDDDDYYHPEFLKANVALLTRQTSEDCVVCHDRFLVFLAATGELKRIGQGWCAGGTLCFYRSLWVRAGFRARDRAVDWYFLRDHEPVRCKVIEPGLYILVRHSSNTWHTIGSQDVDEYMRSLPKYHRPLEDLVDGEDARFYRGLTGTMIRSKQR